MKIKIMIAIAATTLMAQAQTNLIFSTDTIYLPGTNWWTNMSVVGTGRGIVVSNVGVLNMSMPAIIATNAILSGLIITNLGTGDLIGNWYDIGGVGPKIAQITTINDCMLVVTGAASHAINFHADLSGGTNLFQVNMHNVELHSVYEGFEQNNVVGVYDSCRWFAKSVGAFAVAAGLDTGTNRISNSLFSATGNGYGPNTCLVNGGGSETTLSHCVFHIEPSSQGNGGPGGDLGYDAAWTFDAGDVFAVAQDCLFELNSIGNPAPVSMMQVDSSTTGTVKLINCFYYPETNGVIIVNNSHLQFIVYGGNLTPTNFYNPSMVTWH
jgi:hypothetical protein